MIAIRHRGAAGRRRLALLLVAGLGAATIGYAQPAYASTGSCLWAPVTSAGQVVSWSCLPILYQNEPAPDPCLCPDWALDLAVTPALPVEEHRRFLAQVGAGLALLGQAAVADARTADRLRAQALGRFGEAGRLIAGADVRLGAAGIADQARGGIDPNPDAWLRAGGTHLVDGLQFVQRVLADPQPNPWQPALIELEQAFALLTAGRP